MFGYIPSHVEYRGNVPTYILKYSPDIPILVNGKIRGMTTLREKTTTLK